MESAADLPPPAWVPLTPRGVAVFARASAARLMLIELGVAVGAAALMVWGMSATWFPSIAQAIDHLPQAGEISSGGLNWTASSPQLLAENRFLAIAVNLDHAVEARSPAHVQVEFGRSDIRVYSLFGYRQLFYPKGYRISFNYPELKPWWGAWSPVLLGLTGAATFLGLLVSWTLLGTLYSVAAWLFGLYLNRALTWKGSWRLSGAALMPGALLMMAAIALYDVGQLDLVRLIAASVLHFLIGWVYLVLGVLAAPKVNDEPNLKNNPFHQAIPSPAEAEKSPKNETPNPFRPSGG
jgi:hypothetical protein